MKDLISLRNEIDSIDSQLVPLLVRRMEISGEIAEYKAVNSLPILNENREKEILESVGAQSGEYKNELKSVFTAVMKASRDVQKRKIGGE